MGHLDSLKGAARCFDYNGSRMTQQVGRHVASAVRSVAKSSKLYYQTVLPGSKLSSPV